MSTKGIPTIDQYFHPKLLLLIEEIYKIEPQIKNEENIYSCYARSNVQQGEPNAGYEDIRDFMEGLRIIIDDLCGSTIECSLQSTKRSFSDALGDMLALSKLQANKDQWAYIPKYPKEFFYLNAIGHDSGEVKARVAIHVLGPYVKNSLRVVRALAVGLTKLHSIKVCGPGAVNRTDHIVVYLDSAGGLDIVQRLLLEGHIAECIGGTLPPAMQEVQTGVAFAEEPPNVPKSYVTKDGATTKNPGKFDPGVNPFGFNETGIVVKNKQRMSFGEFHTNRIWAGLVKWRTNHSAEKDEKFRYYLFLFEVYQAYLRKGVHPDKPYEFPDRAGAEEKWFANYTFKNRI